MMAMDEKTFTEIVHSTKGVVLSAIRKHLPERYHHAIDDIAQETYLRAYRGLKKNGFRGDSAISTWLYTIARNETLRMTHKLARHEEKTEALAEYRHAAQPDTRRDDDPELLGVVIATLPVKYRAVYELAALGMSDGEISERLSLSRGTVKSRKARGREMLAKLLRKGGYIGHE